VVSALLCVTGSPTNVQLLWPNVPWVISDVVLSAPVTSTSGRLGELHSQPASILQVEPHPAIY
jgi:hypothetical protein